MTADRIRRSFWIDRAPRRTPEPPAADTIRTDLAIVGGGYTGLWTALHAKRRRPNRRVVLVEGATVGHAASGRNGGFVDPSLTHGLAHAIDRWPGDVAALQRLGRENFTGMRDELDDLGIDAHWREGGILEFARTPWQAQWLEESATQAHEFGESATYYGPERLGEVTASPAFCAALRRPDQATVDPYRLALGLLDACLDAGVEVHERTVVTRMVRDGDRVELRTDGEARILADQVALATNAYRPLLARLSGVAIPVYDCALMTEPLSDAQFESIGWTGDEGCADSGNRFHYFRKSDDGRILWGGYDAISKFGSPRREALTQQPDTFAALERNFRETFPQLADVRFTHQWGGMIDSSTRFCVTVGRAWRGQVAYALGYTGLGVAATRFGADAMLDLLEGAVTERTRSPLVARRPVPFPPEPVRSVGVALTQRAMAAEDRTGRRGVWLRALDAAGLGFDS